MSSMPITGHGEQYELNRKLEAVLDQEQRRHQAEADAKLLFAVIGLVTLFVLLVEREIRVYKMFKASGYTCPLFWTVFSATINLIYIVVLTALGLGAVWLAFYLFDALVMAL